MVTFLAQTAVEQATGIAPLDNVLTLLTQFGFFRVVLPFLLIFSLVYAILMKTGILGTPDKSWVKGTSAVISMAIAFFVISSTPVVSLLMTLVPQASFILVVALFLLMIITFALPENYLTGIDKRWFAPIVIILILVFLGIIGAATPDIPFLSGISQGLMGKVPLPEIGADAVNTIIAVLVMFIIPLIIVGMVIWSGKKGA